MFFVVRGKLIVLHTRKKNAATPEPDPDNPDEKPDDKPPPTWLGSGRGREVRRAMVQ